MNEPYGRADEAERAAGRRAQDPERAVAAARDVDAAAGAEHEVLRRRAGGDRVEEAAGRGVEDADARAVVVGDPDGAAGGREREVVRQAVGVDVAGHARVRGVGGVERRDAPRPLAERDPEPVPARVDRHVVRACADVDAPDDAAAAEVDHVELPARVVGDVGVDEVGRQRRHVRRAEAAEGRDDVGARAGS